jgi:hypothetical protein
MKTRKKKLIIYRYSCWWEDAVSKSEWESFSLAIQSLPKIVYTEGYLIHKSKHAHIFSMTFIGDEIGEQMIVPTRAIKKLIKHKDKLILEELDYGAFKN